MVVFSNPSIPLNNSVDDSSVWRDIMAALRNKKRMFHVLLLLTMGVSVIISRLAWIQIIDTREFSKHDIDLVARSVAQREQKLILSTGKGNIFDRNMKSLLAQKEILTVIVFPFSKESFQKGSIEKISQILDLSASDLAKQLENIDGPTTIMRNGEPIEITKGQQEKIVNLNIPGIIATTYTYRDQEEMLAKHLIGYSSYITTKEIEQYKAYIEQGYMNQYSQIGRSGLQRSFQEILMGVGESKIAYFVDNKQRPLNGLASKVQLPKEDHFYPLSLATTIDYQLQTFAEEELKRNRVTDGSIVILDADDASILAMASAPDFNMNQINPTLPDWNNKAIQVIEPGSIFKTVIAIAGLEEGVVDLEEKFVCNGDYGAFKFSCWDEHGEETFAEAYANSCNIVFGEVAKRLGADKIEEYAEKLGVVGTIGWDGEFFKFQSEDRLFQQLSEEEENRVFVKSTPREDVGSILRTGIGQQDVKLSPLAAANLVVTILNNGKVAEPRIVEKVIYKNETDYFTFKAHRAQAFGNANTYQQLRTMMEQVVDEGTGQRLKGANWNLAGKSGTAETKGSKELNHLWFIGYGPVEEPRYAVAVAIKNQPSGPIAQQIFLGLMNRIADLEQEQNDAKSFW